MGAPDGSGWLPSADPPTGAPHPVQNFAPGLSGFPQAVQNVGAGGGASSFAAYLNGKRVKKFNPRHHMIRALIEALLVVGVILW